MAGEEVGPRAFRTLQNARAALLWDVYLSQIAGGDSDEARAILSEWEAIHADEWNRLKPWYAPRLKGRTLD